MSLRQSVQANEPLSIKADEYNAFLEIARRMRHGLEIPAQASAPSEMPPGLVRVRYQPEVEDPLAPILKLGTIVAVKGFAFDPTTDEANFLRRLVLDIDIPYTTLTSSGSHEDLPVAILQGPIDRVGGLARAHVSGVALTRVYINDSDHSQANVLWQDSYYSSYHLESVRDGGDFEIILKESSPASGSPWCLVRFLPKQRLGFWARIEGHLASPSYVNRWIYTVREVVPRNDAVGFFTDVSGGFYGKALNTLEVPNDGIGTEGNGIDVNAAHCCACHCPASSSGGDVDCVELLPIGLGAVVWIPETKRINSGGTTETYAFFSAVNQVRCVSHESGSSSSSVDPPSSSSEEPSSSASESGSSSASESFSGSDWPSASSGSDSISDSESLSDSDPPSGSDPPSDSSGSGSSGSDSSGSGSSGSGSSGSDSSGSGSSGSDSSGSDSSGSGSSGSGSSGSGSSGSGSSGSDSSGSGSDPPSGSEELSDSSGSGSSSSGSSGSGDLCCQFYVATSDSNYDWCEYYQVDIRDIEDVMGHPCSVSSGNSGDCPNFLACE